MTLILSPIRPPEPPEPMFVPLTVDQYHRMIETGILPEGKPIELLDGYLVRKDRSSRGEDHLTVGQAHFWAVNNLAKLGRHFERLGCHLQTQQPVLLSDCDEPEPDAAVILGVLDDYRDRKPSAADVTCVIEVADSSLNHDRTTKLRIYASAGIGQYVILNLAEGVVEVYTQPLKEKGRYQQSQTLVPGQKVSLVAARGKALTMPVRKLLP
jgi:Uma2 family endonuclease